MSGRVVFRAGAESERPRIITLFGDGRPALETAIGPDGRFEFVAVPSGSYDARLLPLNPVQHPATIIVQGRDLTGLEIPAP